jgi:uncharacterized protein YndB with AHSA1/START domain
MKLATKKDIEAPIAKVWAALSDYEAWERSAMRRGVDVERTDKLTKPGPGMSWTSRFAYRARTRKADMKLTEMTGPGLLAFTLASDAVDVATKVEPALVGGAVVPAIAAAGACKSGPQVRCQGWPVGAGVGNPRQGRQVITRAGGLTGRPPEFSSLW